MSGSPSRRARATLFLSAFPLLSAASAQEAVTPLPPIVVTATRSPLEVSRAGSAVDVIDREQIERLGATSLRDALQSVPGVFAHASGGVGTSTNVTIRGGNPGQTVVLIDGVRVGDPTGTDNAFDFGSLALADIERIEVLRGPQSALYGSNAMGGVIQIFTRKGEGPPRKSVSVEGGSYGTLRTAGSISGGMDSLSYAFSVDLLHSDGFPRYGYRPSRSIFLFDGLGNPYPLPPLPRADPTNRAGASGRIGYRLGEAELDVGFSGFRNLLSIDNPNATVPTDVFNSYNQSQEANGYAFGRLSIPAFDGMLRNQVTLFGGALDRSISQTESCPEDFFTSNCRTNYRGVRVGGEYQGDLKIGALGSLTFGARNETERAFLSRDLPANLGGGHVSGFGGQQTTNSFFALHQISLFDRLDLSAAVRSDAVVSGRSFLTGRATAAWRITESGTKLRASIGSGAKIPSLYQRFSQYGDPTLQPEESVGVDAGVDQSLFESRLRLSAGVFQNRFRNLIGFQFSPMNCPPADISGCYFNTGRATTRGVEVSARAEIVPDAWSATASYTYMDAINDVTQAGILQQPRHKAVGSLVFMGVTNLRLEGRMTVVAGMLDFGSIAPVRLSPWYRLDAFANYRFDEHVSFFARLENLTNARYEEVYNYGVAGRSVYAGVRVDW